MKTWFAYNWLKLLALGMALGALFAFPFVYYQLLSWVIMGAGIVTAWQALEQKNVFLFWFFLFVAVVFNPVAPLHLAQDVWRVADISVAVIFALAVLTIRPKAA